jgi:hypothetical protein
MPAAAARVGLTTLPWSKIKVLCPVPAVAAVPAVPGLHSDGTDDHPVDTWDARPLEEVWDRDPVPELDPGDRSRHPVVCHLDLMVRVEGFLASPPGAGSRGVAYAANAWPSFPLINPFASGRRYFSRGMWFTSLAMMAAFC